MKKSVYEALKASARNPAPVPEDQKGMRQLQDRSHRRGQGRVKGHRRGAAQRRSPKPNLTPWHVEPVLKGDSDTASAD